MCVCVCVCVCVCACVLVSRMYVCTGVCVSEWACPKSQMSLSVCRGMVSRKVRGCVCDLCAWVFYEDVSSQCVNCHDQQLNTAEYVLCVRQNASGVCSGYLSVGVTSCSHG